MQLGAEEDHARVDHAGCSWASRERGRQPNWVGFWWVAGMLLVCMLCMQEMDVSWLLGLEGESRPTACDIGPEHRAVGPENGASVGFKLGLKFG